MSKKDSAPPAVQSPRAALGLEREINDLRGLIEKLQAMARDGENLDPQFVTLAHAEINGGCPADLSLPSPAASAPGEPRCAARSIPTAP